MLGYLGKATCGRKMMDLLHDMMEGRDYVAGRSGLVVIASNCGVRGPRFDSHRGRLCLSRQPLRYTALGTGCAPLLQCLGRLILLPSVGW